MGNWWEMNTCWMIPERINPEPVPTDPWDESTANALLDQIDLNSKENVLLYSGIIQAIPLLGGVLKLNRILKDAAKDLSKRMRKQPFTTVLQSLISADFIDRFVISPTLDDARRFQDAVDYTLRVINTAHERNMHRFALQSVSTDTTVAKAGTFRTSRLYSTVTGEYKSITTRTSKAFMLLEARYDMMAVDPIKVWAQRVGLTRPLDSVWDLVPFSFVIDYFTRAGDFISALSDEMSKVEGLTGTITRIHDMWCSVDNRSEVIWTPKAHSWSTNFPSWAIDRVKEVQLQPATLRSGTYERFQIKNPWQFLLSLYDDSADYLTVSTKLSSTRKRTLLELLIQSRLRHK
jgi:hypothetical protein